MLRISCGEYTTVASAQHESRSVNKQKHQPDCSALVFLLLSDCSLHWAQYFITLQSVLHVVRASCYCFRTTPS